MGVLLPTELRKQFCNHLKNSRMDFLDALVQNVFAGRTHLPPICSLGNELEIGPKNYPLCIKLHRVKPTGMDLEGRSVRSTER